MRGWFIVLALLLAGCGAHASGGGAQPTPSPSGTASASAGQFQATASPAHLQAGGTVHVTLTVAGPIDYEIGCVQTLHIWALDAQGVEVWREPVPAIACMAFGHKLLNAGETATFKADWPTSTSLRPGPYTIHGLFLTMLPAGAGARVRENIPVATIEILA